MRASYAYGLSFFSIALLLSVWFIFPFFSFFWLLLFIAIATTPTVYVYANGDNSKTRQAELKRNDLEAVALSF